MQTIEQSNLFKFDVIAGDRNAIIGGIVNNFLKASIIGLAGLGLYRLVDRALGVIERVIVRRAEATIHLPTNTQYQY